MLGILGVISNLFYGVGLFALSARSRLAALGNRTVGLNIAAGLFRTTAGALFGSRLFGVSHFLTPPLRICTYPCGYRSAVLRLRIFSLRGLLRIMQSNGENRTIME